MFQKLVTVAPFSLTARGGAAFMAVPAQAQDTLNIRVMSEDADLDTVPRHIQHFNQVLLAMQGELQASGSGTPRVGESPRILRSLPQSLRAPRPPPGGPAVRPQPSWGRRFFTTNQHRRKEIPCRRRLHTTPPTVRSPARPSPSAAATLQRAGTTRPPAMVGPAPSSGPTTSSRPRPRPIARATGGPRSTKRRKLRAQGRSQAALPSAPNGADGDTGRIGTSLSMRHFGSLLQLSSRQRNTI